MPDPKTLHDTALALRGAYGGDTLAPLRGILNPDDSEGAYAVQALNTDFWVSQGREIAGHKIGLTAKPVQEQLGVDQPDFGVLFNDMEIANGAALDPANTIQPKVEAEIAFILAKDLPEREITRDELAEHIDTACAAIEIVDSRISDWKITFADTVADNGSSAHYVLGDQRKKLADIDLWSCGMVLEVNDEIISTGVGAACLGHPLNAALWLANIFVGRGQPLRAGEVILSGALGPMVTLTPGSELRATVGGLGNVSFIFGEKS